MNPVNLARLDLNLLVVFDTIYREGNLTRAASKLYLSQPAVSHALARLREQFNDPLFERVGHNMLPTPLAKSMLAPVRQALAGLEAMLASGLSFEPHTTTRSFTLAMRDMLETTLLPPLLQRLQQQAPRLQLRSQRVARKALETSLLNSEIDLACDVLLPVSEQICHQRLHQQELLVAMREEHPLAVESLSLEAYCQAQHVQVSSRISGQGVEDFALTKHNQTRHIALRCQNYQAAVRVVLQTDLLLTLPENFARSLRGICVKPFPLALAPIDLYLYWPRKNSHDPGLSWLKEQITELLKS